MTKTYNRLVEALGEVVENILSPSTMMYLRAWSKTINGSFQSTPKGLFQKIEDELNKHGYTLLLDDDFLSDIESSGELDDDFFIYGAASKEPQKNAFVTVKFTKSVAKQYDWRPDGGKLTLDATVKFEDIDVVDMETILSTPESLMPEEFVSEWAQINRDSITEMSGIMAKHRDDLLSALADISFDGDKAAARSFSDKLDFNKYLEVSSAIADDNEAKVKAFVKKYS
jgi:hypothetical protein